MARFLVGNQIDEFVAKHPDTLFFCGEESILPERLATFIEKFGLLPCKDCKRFFQIGRLPTATNKTTVGCLSILAGANVGAFVP